VDAYLAGRIDATMFEKATGRGPTYATTHKPLVEWARERRIPVLAANAPRRLVTGYRKADLAYEDYVASLPEAERRLLPAETTMIRDENWQRFEEAMGEAMAPAFFRGQSLWDDAMAESVARFRDARPEYRVLLIVGAFHVAGGLGTITKYRHRRTHDRVALLVMEHGEGDDLPFAEEDRGAGDAVLKVRPTPRAAPRGPNPHAAPPPEAGNAPTPGPEAPRT
jgi:uncharacterized iron-regulated protein